MPQKIKFFWKRKQQGHKHAIQQYIQNEDDNVMQVINGLFFDTLDSSWNVCESIIL